jgi:hypothetical protein
MIQPEAEEELTRIPLQQQSTFFFKSERVKSSNILMKASVKSVQTINLGVKDSAADITDRIGTKVQQGILGIS